MSNYVSLPKEDWVNVLDAVRAKTSTTALIRSGELAGKIGSIAGSGIDTSDANATNLDIAENKSAYVNGVKVNGSLYDCRGRSDYGVSLMDSYSPNDADGTVDFQIDDLGIFDGSTTFKMDYSELADGIGLTAEKIAEGETILGVTGTHSGGGGIATCSVTIDFWGTAQGYGDGRNTTAYYSTVVEDELQYVQKLIKWEHLVLTDVVKGSTILFSSWEGLEDIGGVVVDDTIEIVAQDTTMISVTFFIRDDGLISIGS